MLRVGLTGGIACGKSHVLRRLARAGIATLDLDDIAHEVLRQGGEAHAALVEAFGSAILQSDGGIDRSVLGTRVFRDQGARALLNGIVHPHIRDEEEKRASEWAGRCELMVTDGALLVESGGHLRFDRLIVAICAEEQQIARLRQRDRLSEGAARRRIEAQMPVGEKRRFASFEIDTAGTGEATDAQVERLAQGLVGLARTGRERATVSLRQAAGCLVNGPVAGVRGLAPLDLLGRLAAAGSMELAELARVVDPLWTAPWYELAARPAGQEAEGPERLSAVAVLWWIGRRGVDRAGALAAAASLARLTHHGSEALAGACLMADALVEVMVRGELSRNWRESCAGWKTEAAKWGAANPASSVVGAVEAAARHPRDVGAARTECRAVGADVEVCGALVGLAVGAALDDSAYSQLVADCRRLGFVE